MQRLKKLNIFSGRKGPLLLIIMDGIGLGREDESNAVYMAKTPNLDRLFKSKFCTWLSEGYRIKMNTIKPVGINSLPFPLNRLKIMLNKADTKNGNKLYGEKCSECHGENGQGADNGPPVWGAKSYNMGVGLSNNLKLASWLIFNMPIEELGLSDKDAVDIATYINSNSRPNFVLKEHLPNENKLGVYNTN